MSSNELKNRKCSYLNCPITCQSAYTDWTTRETASVIVQSLFLVSFIHIDTGGRVRTVDYFVYLKQWVSDGERSQITEYLVMCCNDTSRFGYSVITEQQYCVSTLCSLSFDSNWPLQFELGECFLERENATGVAFYESHLWAVVSVYQLDWQMFFVFMIVYCSQLSCWSWQNTVFFFSYACHLP